VNRLLERLGGFSVRWRWAVIIAWLIILTGLFIAKQQFGGTYVNNYSVSGTDSATGLNRLNGTFSAEGGYPGQLVFHARTGTVTADKSAINTATANVSKLAHVSAATSPFASSTSGTVSKNGTIAYSSVTWKVNPDSLGTDYLNELNKAVSPARKAGLTVDYGGNAGNIGQQASDRTSEAIGLACALILLLFMFGSLIAAAMPLVSALCSVGAGLALLGILASSITFRPPRRRSRPCSASASRSTTGCS